MWKTFKIIRRVIHFIFSYGNLTLRDFSTIYTGPNTNTTNNIYIDKGERK